MRTPPARIPYPDVSLNSPGSDQFLGGLSQRARWGWTHHNVTCAPVERHGQVLHFAVVPKQVLQVLLGRLLVDAGDDDDPSLDG